MTKLRVIDGIKKEKPDYGLLYAEAFINVLKNAAVKFPRFEDYDLDTKRKMIWSGVKMIISGDYKDRSHESLTNTFGIISSINEMMSTLTPREFQTAFPIEKDYNGEKYETKDYFYTKKRIEEFGEDKVIGEDILEFVWEYHNWTISFFAVEIMGIMSDIRRLEGGKGIMEEFLEEQGVTTYTMTEDHKGKQFLTNNDTGEVTKVNKPRPRHLRVVK